MKIVRKESSGKSARSTTVISSILNLPDRFSKWFLGERRSWAVDFFFLLAVEMALLQSMGILMTVTAFGDDTLVHIQKIIDLSKNFLQFQWDPRSFNGYNPSIGFAWTSYAPLALLVSLGSDPLIVFHAAFVVYFLAVGPSVYYFARAMASQRIVSLAASVLVCSAVGYWRWVGGGAYGRLFTLPFAFIALALTFKYVRLQNEGRPSAPTYWFLIGTWSLTLLGDLYISVVPVAIAILFLPLSAGWKNITSGLLRLATVMLPVFALTSWFWIPVAARLTSLGPPPSELIVNIESQFFWVGPILTLLVLFLRRESLRTLPKPEYPAILLSINILCVYFLIMGGITPLWSYIPRVWAPYDSLYLLSIFTPLTVACLSVVLRPFRREIFARCLAVLMVILAAESVFTTISFSDLPNGTTMNNAFAQALSGNLPVSSNYRVSLQGRLLTRGFPYYYPGSFQAGGRTSAQELDPLYQSWYQTEVFYKDDLGALKNVYHDDQPVVNVTGLIGDPPNFASTMFWLDWFGVGTLVLETAFYPVNGTAQGYSQRGALFTTRTVQTSYGPLVFVSPTDPGPELIATNATSIGFYSHQTNSTASYRNLLALLSYLGLDSRYVVPVYLSTLNNIGPGSINTIITDPTTYSEDTARISYLESQGVRINVVSPTLLQQLQTQGPAGTNSLINLLSPTIPLQTQNLTLASTVPSQTVTLTSGQWTAGYSQNANAQLQSYPNNLTLTINIPDSTKPAQLVLDAALPNSLVLSDQLITQVQIESNVNSTVGLVYTSSNFTSNSVEADHQLNPDQLTNLQVPFANFTRWTNPQPKFALATGFNLSITVPPGHRQAKIQLTGASISEPTYILYRAKSPVSLSAAGFLQEFQTSSTSTILSDNTGGLRGSFMEGPANLLGDIIPLATFNSTTMQGFTEVFVIGGTANGQVSLGSIPEADWTRIGNTWTTNQNLDIQSVPAGFRGIVWKETFTNNWNILATDSSNSTTSLPYFYAGPGLVYIPLKGISFYRMNISSQEVLYSVIIPITAASTLVPLIVFRRRIPAIGRIRSSPKPNTESSGAISVSKAQASE